MDRHYKIGKKCLTCGSRVTDHNKTGYCIKHRDITGVHNPFFGKKHSPETVANLKKLCRVASKEKWKNQDYREKVIQAVSKPRRESFKKEQSERVKAWFKKNPKQRILRSDKMRESWRSGKIVNVEFGCNNRSKIELEFFNALVEIYPLITRKTIQANGHWYFPDCIILKDYIIIEFFGDYWHGNPKKFKPNDIIAHKTLAKDVWEHDEKRIKELDNLGYKVIVIWESDYKENKKFVVDTISALLNWESCAL